MTNRFQDTVMDRGRWAGDRRAQKNRSDRRAWTQWSHAARMSAFSDIDDIPTPPVRGKVQASQNDHLGPIMRHVTKSEGRKWSEFWSEICEQADSRSLRGHHLRAHVRGLFRDYKFQDSEYFVDEEGVIRRRPEPKYHDPYGIKDALWLDRRIIVRRIDSYWWALAKWEGAGPLDVNSCAIPDCMHCAISKHPAWFGKAMHPVSPLKLDRLLTSQEVYLAGQLPAKIQEQFIRYWA